RISRSSPHPPGIELPPPRRVDRHPTTRGSFVPPTEIGAPSLNVSRWPSHRRDAENTAIGASPETPTGDRPRRSVRHRATVGAHVDNGVLRKKRRASFRHVLQEPPVSLRMFELPLARLAASDRVRPPAEQPEPQPLSVMVVCQRVVRR